jgi:hypothetical protein
MPMLVAILKLIVAKTLVVKFLLPFPLGTFHAIFYTLKCVYLQKYDL